MLVLGLSVLVRERLLAPLLLGAAARACAGELLGLSVCCAPVPAKPSVHAGLILYMHG